VYNILSCGHTTMYLPIPLSIGIEFIWLFAPVVTLCTLTSYHDQVLPSLWLRTWGWRHWQ
jgi:hypothetical protein